LDVLESALLDRHLSSFEEQALVEVAVQLGLDREVLRGVHMDYLRTMAGIALADSVLAEDELSDLKEVARLLGLSDNEVEGALSNPHTAPTATFALSPGDAVAFTGDMSVPREELVRMAEDYGIIVGGLTKRTALLVAADPDSQSGKAKKARAYGVPVVTEDAFLRMLS
jgi:DNA polymerase-3 subunit epsilon